jgi:hypothetical protein
MNYLNEDEITTIDKIMLCNYCGEKVTEHTSYSNHGRCCDVDYKCNCEGSAKSSELKSELHLAKETLQRIEKDIRLLRNKVASSIRQKLFDKEVAALKSKYEVE